MYQTLFPQGHPYHANVIGSHADIQAAKLDDVQQFFQQYYAPNNASLAIVGDFDNAEAKQLVEKYFGPLKRGPPVPKITAETPPITAEKRLTVTDRIELPRVYMAWLTPPIFKPGDADADIAANILGGGKSSRLYKKLVYEQQIAQNVRASQQSLILGSMFNIEVTARPGHTLEEIESGDQRGARALRSEGPDAQEIERARNTIETQIIDGLETLGGFGGVADRLNSYNHYLGNPGYLQQDILRYRQVTAASVKDFADTVPAERLIAWSCTAVPGEKKLAPEPPSSQSTQSGAKPAAASQASAPGINADEPWRSEPPKGGAARPVQIAAPETFRLSNGLTVILSQRSGLPVVAANLIVRSGSDANPLARPGLANFTAAMLTEGTATRKSLAIADEVARLGGRLDVRVLDGRDPGAGARVDQELRRHARSARRRRPPSDFPGGGSRPRQRASRLAQLISLKDDPGQVAVASCSHRCTASSIRTACSRIGTEASNKSISRADIQSFWQAHFVPSNAALVVAGDISRADVQRLAEAALGSWRGPAAPTPTLAPPQPAGARLIIVDKPGAPQTELRVGTIGTSRKSPDYTPAVVMNAALGRNGFEPDQPEPSRGQGLHLRRILRASASTGPRGPFIVTSAVRTDVTAPALTEVFKELRAMAQQPIPDAELSQAKELIVRSLPTRFETSADAAASYAVPYIYDLGLDYWSGYPKEIADGQRRGGTGGGQEVPAAGTDDCSRRRRPGTKSSPSSRS